VYIELPADAQSLKADFRAPTFKTWLPFKSYSQVKQDYMILTLFNDKADGFFVDLASNHWQDLSNSLSLEHFNNWKGVCAEPNPQYLVGLLSNRKCAVYTNPVSDTNGETVRFTFMGKFAGESDGVLGGIVGAEFDNTADSSDNVKELLTVTLGEILEHAGAPRVIDYLSLDVEGAEWHVLKAFPFERYVFLSITVERPSKEVHHILIKHGYRFVSVLAKFGDCLYVHSTFADFSGVMNKHHQASQAYWYVTLYVICYTLYVIRYTLYVIRHVCCSDCA
jgi:FkbM family methyltransferase